MPNSPKCPECKLKDIDAQTYRVAGRREFKCSKCHKIFTMDFFKENDFLWKDKK